jgi:hypothetical protein
MSSSLTSYVLIFLRGGTIDLSLDVDDNQSFILVKHAVLQSDRYP